jgi:cobalt-zinc-cadmium efflux system protein
MSSSPHQHAVANIKLAFFLNFSFMFIEIIGGILTNSMAILSDALHDLGDSAALGLSWYLAKVSQREPDDKFSYGYQRFSMLGALINGLILIVGSIIILIEAIPRLIHPETVQVEGMVILAIFGVIVNGAAVLRLRVGKTQNEKVLTLHLLEDVLGWIALLIVAVVMLFVDLPILDPILSIGITSYILWNVFKNLRETISVLLQAIPTTINTRQLERALIGEQLPIHSLHDWHLWTMDGEYHVLSFHVVVTSNFPATEIISLKQKIREILKQYNIQHLTIEIEYDNECCGLSRG